MSKKEFDFRTATAADIATKIRAIGVRGVTLQADIQQVGLAAILQVQEHGNATPINELYKALSGGLRQTAFGVWACRFAGVKLNTKKNKKDQPLAVDSNNEPDLEGAIKTPWHTIKTEPSLASALDAEKAVAKLLVRLLKAAKVQHPEVIERLKAAFPDLVKAKGTQTAATASSVAPVLPAVPTVQS